MDTESAVVASALERHWRRAFVVDRDCRPLPSCLVQQLWQLPPIALQLSRKDFRDMVRHFRGIAPEPDGSGYGAWRCGDEWVVDALHSCFQSGVMDGDPLPESLNWALPALLPKKDEPAQGAGRPPSESKQYRLRPRSLSNTACDLFAVGLQALVRGGLEEFVASDPFGFPAAHRHGGRGVGGGGG